jgi:hypothetical protein
MATPRTTERTAPSTAPDVGLEQGAAREWHRRHVLDLDDFSADEIALVLETTKAMKEVLSRDIRDAVLRGLHPHASLL